MMVNVGSKEPVITIIHNPELGITAPVNNPDVEEGIDHILSPQVIG
jgi:hypothetical protein